MPHKPVTKSPWVKGGDFQDRKQLAPIADDLNMHYVTWRQLQQGGAEPPADPLLSASRAKLPWEVRKKRLEEFLKAEGVEKADEPKFMETVVAPWATQGMIEHVIASDYERIDKDEDVLLSSESSFDTNAFAEQREKLPARRKMLEAVGRKIDEMVAAKKTPKEIIDALLAAVPELQGRFEKVSAKSEDYALYDHAQMVLGQFRKLAGPGKPLYDEAMLTKLILFHDIEKTNSKAQYGSDPVGEQKLTVDEIRKYGGLWKDAGEVRATVGIVGGDPFGQYMKKQIDRDQAFMAIVAAAREAGVGFDDYVRFFHEHHRFYQADFSSYTSASSYTTKEGEPKHGKGGAFDKLFAWDGQQLALHSSGRFRYAPAGEAHYLELEAMFAGMDTVTGHLLRLDPGLTSLVKVEKAKEEEPKEAPADDDELSIGIDEMEQRFAATPGK